MKMYISELRNVIRSMLLYEGLGNDLRAIADSMPTDGSIFVHFSTLNKLGINPLGSEVTNSGDGTPLGIYGFMFNETVKQQLLSNNLTFAGPGTYAHFFRARNPARCLVLQNLTWETGFKATKDFATANAKNFIIKTPEKFKQSCKKCIKQTPGDVFWYHTHIRWSKGSLDSTRKYMNMGLEGIIDAGGSIIHSEEPAQAVFFTAAFVEQIQTTEWADPDVKSVTTRKIFSLIKKQEKSYEQATTEEEKHKIVLDTRGKLKEIDPKVFMLRYNDADLEFFLDQFKYRYKTAHDLGQRIKW